MTTSTRIARLVIAAAAALAVMAPAAQAHPFAGSAGAAGVGTTTGAISRAAASLPPDRADGLGSTRLPTVPQPTVLVRTTTSDSFSWTDAGLGAASGLAAGIVALGGAMALRGRRRVALSS